MSSACSREDDMDVGSARPSCGCARHKVNKYEDHLDSTTCLETRLRSCVFISLSSCSFCLFTPSNLVGLPTCPLLAMEPCDVQFALRNMDHFDPHSFLFSELSFSQWLILSSRQINHIFCNIAAPPNRRRPALFVGRHSPMTPFDCSLPDFRRRWGPSDMTTTNLPMTTAATRL